MTYLDTHIAVWLSSGNTGKLTPSALKQIRGAHSLLISPAVLLELEYLYEIRRITRPAQDILSKLESETALQLCHLDFRRVIEAAIREAWTRDTFDRLIVAQAKANGLAYLVSSDEKIRDNYPRTIW